MPPTYNHLSQEQVNGFLEDGYIIIRQAFTPEKAAEWTKTMWTRLGIDPNDRSTWNEERVHMPWHRREEVATFAPKAWDAITDLLGGADRIDEESSAWGDSFIVNFGTPELETCVQDKQPMDLDNWHVDGDFFVHYLDSPEQALLVVPIFSDILPRAGGTFICPDGLDKIATYLSVHPEGVLPGGTDLSFTPSTTTFENGSYHNDPHHWSHLKEIKTCSKFVELTGKIGDVVLLHPLMLHSASKNYLRIPRVITNPPVSLKDPFNFSRDNPADYSLVELKTLKALGKDRFEFKPTTERRRIVPARVLRQRKMLEDEKRRLELVF